MSHQPARINTYVYCLHDYQRSNPGQLTSLPTATKHDRKDESEDGYLQAPTPQRKVELGISFPSLAKCVVYG